MTYLEPLCPVFVLAIVFGLFRLIRRGERMPLILAIAGFFLLLWPPVDWLLSRPLEGRYPIRPLPAGDAEAIVVLSAGISPPHFEQPYSLADADTFDRCEHAAWLYHHWRSVPVLASGGRGPVGEPFSRTMRELLKEAGVPDQMIWTEEQSRSTHENAAFSAGILRKHGISRIALVVEAQSMLRASLCFQREGIQVFPAPSGFRQLEWPVDALPSWKALERNERTLHESLGLVYYSLRGWV
jgi:uncharacterized SAM-binding protein YcdF (DUF218 family)